MRIVTNNLELIIFICNILKNYYKLMKLKKERQNKSSNFYVTIN